MLDMMAKHSLVLFCYEKEDTTTIRAALECATGLSDIAVIVGAEGGFSEKEAAAIVDKGAKCVSLGPRILRCETAPEYILSVVSYRFEM
jgi:16S rRNA (uracil1498-N3)-methyltransferase